MLRTNRLLSFSVGITLGFLLAAACSRSSGIPLEVSRGGVLVFTVGGFADGARIPNRFTCDGDNVSPKLSWSGIPDEVQSYVIIMDDPDATGGTFTHWVLFNIPAATAGLPEGVKTAARLDTGGIHGANDAGKVGYVGPCPPPGPDHRYRITFYVLDTNLSLPPGSSASKVIAAMEGHILSQTRVTALYSRQP